MGTETTRVPRVTVIVAARNAARTIEACLGSLRALEYPDVEVVVADDGSTDDTVPLARASGARVLPLSHRGPSAARNAAVWQSTSEIVAFTDADCTVSRGWLDHLVTGLQQSGAAAVGGPQRNVFPAESTRDVRALDAFFRCASLVSDYTRSDAFAHEVDHNASCNSAYRRAIFLEAGGFATDLWPGEDVDLDRRLREQGHRCYYVPGAVVWHHRPGDTAWFSGMMRRYGWAQRQLVRRHGRFRSLHWVPAALAAAGVLQLLLVAPRLRVVALGVDAGLLAGGLAVLARGAPVTLWPSVLRYASVAVIEWNRGYLAG